MDLATWLTFAAASVALLLIPGPTVLLVLAQALAQGRRVAVASAGGVAVGDALAMGASLAGLGALVATSATLFAALKWIGAGYLLWLGIKIWRGAGSGPATLSPVDNNASLASVFGHAALVTALNPKSIAFFIAFVPQFLDPAAPLGPQFAVLMVTFVGLAGLNALAYALLASHLRARLERPSVLRALGRLGGGALIAMAAATAVSRQPT